MTYVLADLAARAEGEDRQKKAEWPGGERREGGEENSPGEERNCRVSETKILL